MSFQVQAESSSLRIEQFLLDISEASYRHGLAVDHGGTVYIMEGEDYSLRYRLSPTDCLVFDG